MKTDIIKTCVLPSIVVNDKNEQKDVIRQNKRKLNEQTSVTLMGLDWLAEKRCKASSLRTTGCSNAS